jgi:hypothetical protein
MKQKIARVQRFKQQATEAKQKAERTFKNAQKTLSKIEGSV